MSLLHVGILNFKITPQHAINPNSLPAMHFLIWLKENSAAKFAMKIYLRVVSCFLSNSN